MLSWSRHRVIPDDRHYHLLKMAVFYFRHKQMKRRQKLILEFCIFYSIPEYSSYPGYLLFHIEEDFEWMALRLLWQPDGSPYLSCFLKISFQSEEDLLYPNGKV